MATRSVALGDDHENACCNLFGFAKRSAEEITGVNDPTVREVDNLIAQGLSKMSIQDREIAQNDVHGVDLKEKDPTEVNSCLMRMDAFLRGRVQNQQNTGEENDEVSVYLEALQSDSSYVEDRNFRMKFLRAEHWDATLAAERFLRFFQYKRRLFGSSKLVQKITQADLNDDDMTALKTGEGQISPIPDAAGRVVMFFGHALRQCKHLDNSRRAMYYMIMAAMESEAAQKLGIVGLFYVVDAPKVASINAELRNALPICFASLHLCCNAWSQYIKASIAIIPLSKENRVRYRFHYGSHVECLYQLVTFGIAQDSLPVNGKGEYSTDSHLRWLAQRREMELKLKADGDGTMPAPFADVDSATDGSASSPEPCMTGLAGVRQNDVLLGRGRHAMDHEGNTKFRKLVDVYMSKYEAADRFEKTCIAEAIVHIIQDSNGRFLKRGLDSALVEVDGTEARKKVAHAFRNRRKMLGLGEKSG
eukprot:Nitzschia sp. Nitz4//scaffold95_size97785//45877//47543//NITZ4_004667-RA/size97785-augustus-gene-0.107-mRNA-1//-1//CDS//3329560472//2625//frame0